MMVIKQLLPDNCYSNHALNNPKGVVIHYFSAIHVNPKKWDDPTICFDLFKSLKLSAHFMVARDGSVYQLVPEDKQAWHAGESTWDGLSGLNKFYFGIEFIATHTSGFTEDQYAVGQMLVAQLMSRYNIPLNHIVGHQDVAPGRKKDPGPLFDWHRFKGGLQDVV